MRRHASKQRRAARLECTPLESRALLSGLTGLTPSITTDAPVYQPGRPIQIQFTDTNNTSQPIKFVYGPSDDGFDVSEGGAVVYKSNGGVNPMVLLLDTLQPGQSKSFDFTWNGVSGTSGQGTAVSVAPATFTVTNQLDPSVSATFQIASPLSVSLNPQAGSVAPGQPAVFHWVATNTGTAPVTIRGAPGRLTVTAPATAAPVYSASVPATAPTITLQPGQSWTQSITWPGSSTGYVPVGVYDVSFDNGLQSAGTQVGIGVSSPIPTPNPISPAPPLTGIGVSLSTQQVGHHQLFTLTLTNYENGPVAFSRSSRVARFILKENGKVIWHSTARVKLATRAARSLSPGEAIQLQSAWPVRLHHARAKGATPALYQVTATAGGHAATTTFEL
jgi:Domain of unknown function (DUF4232)